MRRVACLFALVLIISPSASTVYAQDERVRLSGLTSIALGDGGPAAAISVSSGFQLAPHAGFEIEGLYIPNQDFDRTNIVLPAIYPTPRVETDGRTIAFLSSFVTDLQAGRLRPYALFGGGIANVRRRVTIDFPPGILARTVVVGPDRRAPAPQGDVQVVPIRRPITSRIAENDLALAAGAGLDIRIWARLSLAADVRYLRLFQTTQGTAGAENLTRVGARVAYWF